MTGHTLKRWLPVAALVLLVAGSWWLLRRIDVSQTQESAPSHVADYFMKNFVTTTMDKTGKPRRRLEAAFMEHFPDTGTSELKKPYLIMYSGNDPPWHVRSARGWVSSGGDVIFLLGPVHIWRDDARGEIQVDVHTRDLRVLPDTSYGETDKPVVIRTPTTESSGVGMRAYLKEDRLQLLSRVHTHYERKADEKKQD